MLHNKFMMPKKKMSVLIQKLWHRFSCFGWLQNMHLEIIILELSKTVKYKSSNNSLALCSHSILKNSFKNTINHKVSRNY
jgi:hypothetical protein